MTSDGVVRQPLRAAGRSSRAPEERLAMRFPRLAAALRRSVLRRPPASRVRRAALRRAVVLALEAYNRRDLESVASGYHADLEYRPYREFVDGGLAEPLYRGPDGYRAYVEATYDVWGADVRLEPTELIDLGDRFVILADMPMRAQASGIALSQKYAGVVTVRDGRLVAQQDYLDQAEALAAVGLSRG